VVSINETVGRAFEAYRAGRNDEAEAICRKVASLTPTHSQACFLLGMVLRKRGSAEEAVHWLKQAARLQPSSPEVLNGLGSAYSDLRDHRRAAECYARAIQVNPRYVDAYYNMGNACQRLREFQKALACYNRALELNPRDHEVWTNLGKLHKELNQVDQAIAAYDRALRVQPDFALAHWNRAIILLLAGRLQEGFQEYEWRWRMRSPIFPPRNYPQPLWDGRPLGRKTLFIHAEQGFGDAIQFVRYLWLARRRAARVILETPSPLRSLFEESGCADAVIGLGQPPPPFDCFIPLMSLPRLFQTTLETIPRGVTYLRSPSGPDIPHPPEGRLKVGLAWAGNATHDGDATRSMRLEQLTPILEVPGVAFFSLQVPVPSEDEPLLRSTPQLANLAAQLKDFRNTAAIIHEMDLVISVDTAVAHLAGALGKPAWTFIEHSPDWRWLLGRSESPWYPTMRLFRQTEPGHWQPIIRQAAEELRRLLPPRSNASEALEKTR